MASRREQVIEAVHALVKGALPNAKVRRNVKKPTSVDPGGTVIVRDGDPGEPDVILSPLAYTYAHEIALELAVMESVTLTREQLLDQLIEAIGLAIEADRTLGVGLEWCEGELTTLDDAEEPGMEPLKWAVVTLTCTYTVTNPLAV